MSSRLLAGPALRLQPDSRLVRLFRDGYESAFEEIVRRYGKPLQRYASAIVTAQRAEDVTQDALSKAFVGLADSDKEINLRPWLYRILRNTALNALRDAPPAAAELEEARFEGSEGPAETLERREEVRRLVEGLRGLPESQRAAIVMRELEGLSHEQIAASLGLSGGAVRQSIYRARSTLRDAVGLLLPLPLLRTLLDGLGGSAATGGAVAAGGAAGVAGIGTAGTGGGLSAGLGVKAGVAALLAAGTVTTGVAINHHGGQRPAGSGATAAQSEAADDSSGDGPRQGSEREPRDSNRGHGSSGKGSGSGSGHSGSGHSGSSGSGSSGSGSSGSGSSGGGSHSGSGSSGSGGSGSGSSGSGSGSSGSESSGSGSGSSGSGSGSGDDGGGGPGPD